MLEYTKSTFQANYRTYQSNRGLIDQFKQDPDQNLSWIQFVTRTREVIEIEDSEVEIPNPRSTNGNFSQALRDSSPYIPSPISTTSHLDELDADITPTLLDPTKVCPYCDEKWPDHPSTTLLRKRAVLESLSFLDPGPHSANPGHRCTRPAILAVDMCSLHRFETTTIDLAIIKRWPQSIDFKKHEDRIWDMLPAIQDIIEDPSNSLFYQLLQVSIKKLGLHNALGFGGKYDFTSKYGQGTG